MGYFNGQKVLLANVMNGGGAINVPQNQATTTIIQTPLRNINGRELSNFESNLVTIGEYEAYKITKGGNVLTEDQAKDYMEYMTGSRFLPVYNFEKPQNSLFITFQLLVLKPQYDQTNGLLLFKMMSLAPAQ